MTDLRKAAEMALEALEQTPTANKLFDAESYEKQKDAIDALRQALAQPEQEPVAWMCEGNKWGVWQQVVFLGNDLDTHKDSSAFRNWKPLYIAPPKREWVGLTKDDVDSWELPDTPTVFEFAQFIESKLKEKNT